jgi:hypothetical protein
LGQHDTSHGLGRALVGSPTAQLARHDLGFTHAIMQPRRRSCPLPSPDGRRSDCPSRGSSVPPPPSGPSLPPVLPSRWRAGAHRLPAACRCLLAADAQGTRPRAPAPASQHMAPCRERAAWSCSWWRARPPQAPATSLPLSISLPRLDQQTEPSPPPTPQAQANSPFCPEFLLMIPDSFANLAISIFFFFNFRALVRCSGRVLC